MATKVLCFAARHRRLLSVAKIIIKHLTGARRDVRENFPTSRFTSIFIGRDMDCDITFSGEGNDLVSRSHAVIEWEEESVAESLSITDLLSSNGTYVNGKRISDITRLHAGDTVHLGATGPSFEVIIEAVELVEKEEDENEYLTDPTRPEPKLTRQVKAVPDVRDLEFEARRKKK